MRKEDSQPLFASSQSARGVRVRRPSLMVAVHIRAATPRDLAGAEEVSALATKTLRAVYRPTRSMVSTARKRKILFARLVALRRDQVVGTVRYRVVGTRLHLLGLGVHPRVRRQGIATALINRSVRFARRAGLKRLSLYTVRETGNVPIFEKMGFTVVRETSAKGLRSSIGKRLREVYMIRETR